MPDIMYCPRLQCQNPVLVDKKDRMGFCNVCTFAFCTRCKLTYHGVDGCKWERDFIKRRDEVKEKRSQDSSRSLVKLESKLEYSGIKVNFNNSDNDDDDDDDGDCSNNISNNNNNNNSNNGFFLWQRMA